MVSCIVPAFNESSTIIDVLDVLSSSPLINEIIVVDDGSSDNTSEIVKQNFPFVTVAKHEKNRGKAAALTTGAQKATSDVLFFCDADLIGLTPAHIDELITPVLHGKTKMMCGIQEFINPFGSSRWYQILTKNKEDRVKKTGGKFNEFILGLGGEKVLSKKDFLSVPDIANSHYGVENKIIEYFKEKNLPFEYLILKGVGHRHKIKKWGLKKGMVKEMKAYFTFVRQHSSSFMKYVPRPSFKKFIFPFSKKLNTPVPRFWSRL